MLIKLTMTRWKSTAFPWMLPDSLLPQCLRREPRDEAMDLATMTNVCVLGSLHCIRYQSQMKCRIL